MDRTVNARLGPSERALAKENKWRVQRFGLAADLIDPFGEPVAADFPSLARRLAELVLPHAEALDCVAEVEHVGKILVRGTSADRQLGLFERARADGLAPTPALARVKTWLKQETLAVG
jgi:carboxylate-amine ligase